jgi:hypothetical protein
MLALASFALSCEPVSSSRIVPVLGGGDILTHAGRNEKSKKFAIALRTKKPGNFAGLLTQRENLTVVVQNISSLPGT